MVDDRDELLIAICDVADRLVAVVKAVPDPRAGVPATPEWTVAEAFAHVATAVPRYLEGARHRGEWAATPGELPELNARYIAGVPTRDIDRLADDLRSSIATLRDDVAALGDHPPEFPFHGGAPITVDAALAVLLGEFVVHGHDLAAVARRPWPIDPRHVELIIRGVTTILPAWVNRSKAGGHTARYELRLRGQGFHTFTFTDGELAVERSAASSPDVIISAEPATLLLVVYKRRSQWPAILTGRLLAWGRRPWLALGFADLFHAP